MFRNMKLWIRLSMGFLLVLMLLATVSVISVSRMGQLDARIGELVKDRFPKTVWANEMIDGVNMIALSMRNMIIVQSAEERQIQVRRVEDARAGIMANLEHLQ